LTESESIPRNLTFKLADALLPVLFREAVSRARELDKEFEATGKAEGDFWGLPSSFKGKSLRKT
jgi:hypothetical protein